MVSLGSDRRSVSAFGRRLVSVGVVVAVLAGGLVAGVPGVSGAAGVAGFSSRGIPLGGQVLFGSATTTDVAVMEAAIGGKVGIRRSYYQASQVSAAVDRARADLVAGRVPWLSFKAPASWASMASGAGDAWAQDLANRLGGLPGPVWVAVHHEPEGDGPAADWKAMQQRLSPIFRAKPNIAYTMILMGWNQFFANKADQSLDVYWPCWRRTGSSPSGSSCTQCWLGPGQPLLVGFAVRRRPMASGS